MSFNCGSAAASAIARSSVSSLNRSIGECSTSWLGSSACPHGSAHRGNNRKLARNRKCGRRRTGESACIPAGVRQSARRKPRTRLIKKTPDIYK
jgi:hypothetical protein